MTLIISGISMLETSDHLTNFTKKKQKKKVKKKINFMNIKYNKKVRYFSKANISKLEICIAYFNGKGYEIARLCQCCMQ